MGVRKLWSTVAGSEDLHTGERIKMEVVSRSETNRDEQCKARILRQERPMTTTTYLDREGRKKKKTIPDHNIEPSAWKIVYEGLLDDVEKKWDELDH